MSGALARRRRFRRAMYGSVIAGTVGFIIAESAGFPLVGVGLYWLGFAGFVAVWQGTSMTLFDERDRALERRAVSLTFGLFALATILLWPTVLVLSEVVGYDPPPAFDGALLTLSAQAGVFAVVYTWLRYR